MCLWVSVRQAIPQCVQHVPSMNTVKMVRVHHVRWYVQQDRSYKAPVVLLVTATVSFVRFMSLKLVPIQICAVHARVNARQDDFLQPHVPRVPRLVQQLAKFVKMKHLRLGPPRLLPVNHVGPLAPLLNMNLLLVHQAQTDAVMPVLPSLTATAK